MGRSYAEFVKFPRTPHLFGSTGTADDTHLDAEQSAEFLANDSLIVEEKIDGTNVGIHFSDEGRMILQCRGHLLTEGMHPQYDLFKQFAAVKRHKLEKLLENRFILYGEWMYARHTIHYRSLPHYFLEIDVYDKQNQEFLSREHRRELLLNTAICSVPILHERRLSTAQLMKLIGKSTFSDEFMEGLYLRMESGGIVTGRAKFVRQEFLEQAKQNDRWRHEAMVTNLLAAGVDIWL